jgi:hypothetical protein
VRHLSSAYSGRGQSPYEKVRTVIVSMSSTANRQHEPKCSHQIWIAVKWVPRSVYCSHATHRDHLSCPGKEVNFAVLELVQVCGSFLHHGSRHLLQIFPRRQGCHDAIMNFNGIARAILAVEVMLHYSTCGLIMAGNTFPSLGNEWVKGQDLRIAVDGTYQVRGGDNVDLAIEHVQSVDWELAFGAAEKFVELPSWSEAWLETRLVIS